MSVPRFTLHRRDSTGYATYGDLVDGEERLLCKTLELPLVDANHDGLTDPNVSCIPPGTYTAHRRKAADTRHKYDVFELDDVPGRDHVQIHIANTPDQLLGCITVGTHYGQLAGRSAVLGSGEAYRRWMQVNKGIDRITLTVVAPPPTPNAS